MFALTAKGFYVHSPSGREGTLPNEWFERLFLRETENCSLRRYEEEQWDVMFFVQGRAEMILHEARAGLPRGRGGDRWPGGGGGVGCGGDVTGGQAAKVGGGLAGGRGELAQQNKVGPGGDARAHAHLEDELGDLLFACINLCRRAGVHPALALDRATDKFARRFEAVAALARQRGIVLSDARIAPHAARWNQVKPAE